MGEIFPPPVVRRGNNFNRRLAAFYVDKWYERSEAEALALT